MGAHVWGPAFLRDHLLSHLQLSGWSMDWYAGMPVYRFYMVVPALAIVALDALLPVRRGVQARRRLRARPAAVLLLGVRPAGPLPLPDAGAVRLRRAVLRARRELQHLRRQPQVDDGRRVLVLHRPQPDDPRPRPAGRRDAHRQVPQLGGDRARPGDRLPRHRRHLHRPRGARHRARQHRRACAASCYGLGRRRRRRPAVDVLDRTVRRQPPVHDGHEVRRPSGGRQRLVLGHVLPAHRAARHPRHGARRDRLRRRDRPPPRQRHRPRRDRAAHRRPASTPPRTACRSSGCCGTRACCRCCTSCATC